MRRLSRSERTSLARIAVASLVSVLVALVVRTVDPTSALYTDSAQQGGLTVTTGSWGSPTGTYPTAVLAQSPYLYWRLGETAPVATTADASGAGRTGTPNGAVYTWGASGLVTGTDTAVAFTNLNSRRIVQPTQVAVGPDTLTIAVWLSTTRTQTSRIIGFGSSATALSAAQDRTLWMNAAGQLVWGVKPLNVTQTITSPGVVNDGQPHLVVASLGAAGTKLYVDGVLVATNPAVTFGTPAAGYWRLGNDTMAPWGLGTNGQIRRFVGTLDELAIFPTQLTDADVTALFAAR